MRKYYRLMLGAKSVYAEECFKGNFIGTDFSIPQDLSKDLIKDWREFNHKYIPIYQKTHPDKSKIAAGLTCGALWTVSKGINRGDIVLCPDGMGSYYVGSFWRI
jgi:restriction system protein